MVIGLLVKVVVKVFMVVDCSSDVRVTKVTGILVGAILD